VDGVGAFLELGMDEFDGNHTWGFGSQGGVYREDANTVVYPYLDADFDDAGLRAELNWPGTDKAAAWRGQRTPSGSESSQSNAKTRTQSGEDSLTMSLLARYVQTTWEGTKLEGHDKAAIYGAGAHTKWVFDSVDLAKCPEIVAVLDDSPGEGRKIRNCPVLSPEKFDVDQVSVVLLSSNTFEDAMVARLTKLYGDKVKLIRLYEDFRIERVAC